MHLHSAGKVSPAEMPRRYQLTIRDDLTGLYNRRYFREYMAKNWPEREGQAFLSLYIDDFELYKELYGGACSDEILKWCGQAILSSAAIHGRQTAGNI